MIGAKKENAGTPLISKPTVTCPYCQSTIVSKITVTKKAMKIQWGCAISSKMPWELKAQLLKLSPGTFQEHTLFEGIDFDLMPDGEIIFKE